MRPNAFRSCCMVLAPLLLSTALLGQGPTQRADSAEAVPGQQHLGYPHDWSSRHLLMPGMQADAVLDAGERDPRYVYNMVMREIAIDNFLHRRRRHKPKVDWAVSLENGYVPQNQYPAKYQFDVTTENCQSDYVLFGLTVTSGTQANLVGINNLYTSASPACNGGSPSVAFAYNTAINGGQIKTSPVLSEDGTKVAFIESTNKASYFHVLVLPNPIPNPPNQVGTVLKPQATTSCTKPTTPGCMTSVQIQKTATDSNSSPWVDYSTDTAYVGADNGLLYKITPVFGGGAPAVVSDTNWPVTLSASGSKVLTAPIVDDTPGLIFVGDGQGYLYSVNLTSPAKKYAARQTIGWAGHGAGTGVVDPPIVVTDPANAATDQVFAFTGCSSVNGIGGAITQNPANFTTSGTVTTGTTVNLGSSDGTGNCTGLNAHVGTFDNEFWLTGSTSGHMIACGFVDGGGAPSNPEMYFFPFSSNVITSTGSSTFVINNTIGEECSPLTEFYNGSSDMLFFGVGNSSNAYVESSVITSSLSTPNCTSTPTSSCVTSPSALGGTSGIIIDNQVSNGGTNIYFSTLAAGSVNGQKCNVGGGVANPYCAVKLTQTGLQ